MKDGYHIELTDDSASLNSIIDPLYDAMQYARKNVQEHRTCLSSYCLLPCTP